MKKRSLSAILGVLLVVLAGCRVPSDSSPRAIPTDQVPFDLLAPSTTLPPPTLPIATEMATVYLIDGQHLTRVTRSVPAPSSLGTVLATLVQGPTAQEAERGWKSSLSPQTSVLSTQTTGGTAVINMSDSFSDLGVQDQIAGLAQLVYTATELAGVQNVSIQLNAKPATVQRGDGSTTKDLLTRADYVSFAPA